MRAVDLPAPEVTDPADPVAVVHRHLIHDGVSAGRRTPVVHRRHGARIETRDGRVLLDAASGGFGGSHARVRAAIADQARRVALSSRILVSRPLAGAVAALAEFCPGPLSVSYLCNSGDEALDSALKLAKGTHPRRPYVLGIRGEDFGTLSHGQALGQGRALLPGAPFLPRTVSAEAPEELLEQVDESVSAVVIAPAAPGRPLGRLPLDWWVALRERCHRTDTLLVLDERHTGPARLGRDLGVGALGMFPDALILGDTLGADAVPVGVAVLTPAAYRRVYGGRNPSLHGSTFGANPLSAAAVSAVLDAVVGDDLAARQRDFEHAALRLRDELADPAGAFGELHADGSLLWVRARGAAAARRLAGELADRGVLVRDPVADVVTLTPPLTAEREDIDQILQRLAESLKALDAEEAGR
ncbi:aminotransferase class III-fold pyridoxal phosphate-dependent enzyme [Streptomyces capitiformicae]|uniref:Ornithine--oxo-acid transaminase n=1 Tax=Streptomyces capitiformicae TaxID=2014920 RepID=A0A919DMN6_9ACTN|nr:aminotransferase class III-fold pyridoxal phosphate-dependent enzyme [Streptomyces capitiformicae]GHE57335.1 ornithine--oxo-acid transaminase [Streptomyces capitiformicae]